MRVGFSLFHQKSISESDKIRNFNVLRPIFEVFSPS